MSVEVRFLGTGTSHGVPMVGCRCKVCTSPDPRDIRNRTSVLVETENVSILIDTPPELRVSCIRWGVSRVDGVLFTHHHADHLMGFDDIRRFNEMSGAVMDCYASVETLEQIRRAFSYAFRPAGPGGGIPAVDLIPVEGPFQIRDVSVVPLPVKHGSANVLGYRIGAFAYVTDVKTIPEETAENLQGLDLLVLGVLRHSPHSTHLSVSEALDVVERLAPRRALFTHMGHTLGHAETEANLPQNVRLACDGLRLSCP